MARAHAANAARWLESNLRLHAWANPAQVKSCGAEHVAGRATSGKAARKDLTGNFAALWPLPHLHGGPCVVQDVTYHPDFAKQLINRYFGAPPPLACSPHRRWCKGSAMRGGRVLPGSAVVVTRTASFCAGGDPTPLFKLVF